jgi:hypothetical protein
MARSLYLLIAFVALAAWAGAQGPMPPPPLSAEDKLRLHRSNSALIGELVRDGVKMSRAGRTVDRAARCRDASQSLVNAIKEAAKAENAERVAELTALYRDLVRDGLVPVMAEVKRNVTPESPDAKALGEVRGHAVRNVSDLKTAIPTGKLADSPRVKDALKQLDELAEQLQLK